MNIICWMIKLIKIKFTSTIKRLIARFQRFFLLCNFRRLSLSAIKFFTRLFRVVKIRFDFSSWTSKNVRILFSFFFRASKIVRILFVKDFCVVVVLCVVDVFRIIVVLLSLFRFSQSFLLFFAIEIVRVVFI